MNLEVFGEMVDAGREESDLDFGRAGVAFGALELRNDLGLVHFNDMGIPMHSNVKHADAGVETCAVKVRIYLRFEATCKGAEDFSSRDR